MYGTNTRRRFSQFPSAKHLSGMAVAVGSISVPFNLRFSSAVPRHCRPVPDRGRTPPFASTVEIMRV